MCRTVPRVRRALLALLAWTAAAAVLVLPAGALAGGAAADEGVQLTVTQVDPAAFPDVRVSATVTDAQGKPFRGLTATDLTLTENGVAQTATIDLTGQAAPVALAIVLDVSGSMSGRPLADAKQAMTTFINALGPGDQASVILFNTSVRVERSAHR